MIHNIYIKLKRFSLTENLTDDILYAMTSKVVKMPNKIVKKAAGGGNTSSL